MGGDGLSEVSFDGISEVSDVGLTDLQFQWYRSVICLLQTSPSNSSSNKLTKVFNIGRLKTETVLNLLCNIVHAHGVRNFIHH